MAFIQRSKVGATVLATFLALGCGGSDNGGNGGTTDPPTTGNLRVTVNADGSGIAGVTVRFFASGGSTPTTTQTTGTDGRTTFSDVAEASHDVAIEVPEGFVLADGEDDRKSASVTAGSTEDVTFSLEEDPSTSVVEVFAQDNLTFSEPNLVIAPGTTVRWVNQGVMLHTVTPEGHSEWSSATLANNGDTFTHTFDAEGTFEYFCQPHVGQGMIGTVTVQAPS